MKHIDIVFAGRSPSWLMGPRTERRLRLTDIWDVIAKSGGVKLGQIRWFGRWRCYAFYPKAETVFEKTCLRDIANFCEESTRYRNAGRFTKKGRA